MNKLGLATFAALTLTASSAFAQYSTSFGQDAKDQEQTTGIPAVQPYNPGFMPMPSGGDRLRDRISREDDQTTGVAKQGPAVRGGFSGPSYDDWVQQDVAREKDQERTTGIPYLPTQE
jgi:hypothetical protein